MGTTITSRLFPEITESCPSGMGIDLLDLPNELILQILELIVSTLLWHGCRPVLFKTVSFQKQSMFSHQAYTALSGYLDVGKELVFSRCTKKLNIDTYGAGDPPEEHFPWLRLLDNLIPTLVHLESLQWSHWPNSYPVSPLVLDVFNSFGSLQNLRELIIEVVIVTPFPGFTLKSFSNLSSVAINWQIGQEVSPDFISEITDLLPRCPTLANFAFNIPRPYYPSQVPVFAPFFVGLPPTACLKLRLLDLTGLCISADDFRAHLRHFKCLKVLRLMFNRHPDSPEQNNQICHLLLENSIHLDELTIDTTHPDGVLKYLSSYSGLNHLQFRSRYPGADTPEGVDYFFKSVLPRHNSTLRELHLGWFVETLWTKDMSLEHLAQIEKCQQLTRLYCSVTLNPGYVKRADRLLGAWLDTALKLPRLEYLTIYSTYPGRRYPVIDHGKFVYIRNVHGPSDSIRDHEKFGLRRIEKLKAERVVPFKLLMMSLTLGP